MHNNLDFHFGACIADYALKTSIRLHHFCTNRVQKLKPNRNCSNFEWKTSNGFACFHVINFCWATTNTKTCKTDRCFSFKIALFATFASRKSTFWCAHYYKYTAKRRCKNIAKIERFQNHLFCTAKTSKFASTDAVVQNIVLFWLKTSNGFHVFPNTFFLHKCACTKTWKRTDVSHSKLIFLMPTRGKNANCGSLTTINTLPNGNIICTWKTCMLQTVCFTMPKQPK